MLDWSYACKIITNIRLKKTNEKKIKYFFLSTFFWVSKLVKKQTFVIMLYVNLNKKYNLLLYFTTNMETLPV